MAKRTWTLVHKSKGARVYKTANGKKVTKLTPTGKVVRYGRELDKGVNSKTGEKLSACAAGYRMGYRAALGEQAAIYNYKNK